MKTIELEKGTEINVKRFYMPGVEIKTKCPKCGKEISYTGDDYLSYPVIGEKEELCLYCSDCDVNYLIDAKLNIGLKYDMSTLRAES